MLETTYRPLISLVKLPGNPRAIRDNQFKILCDSLRENPDYFEARPLILSDRTGELVIIAGNQRYQAALANGLTEVPTIVLPGLTEEREREIIIRDNVSNGEWDMEELANSWDLAELRGWGVDLPDWDVGGDAGAVADDNHAGEPPADPVTVLGDLYELNNHRVLCGDSTDSGCVNRLMDGKKADMVFTDPPYNIGFSGTMSRTTKNGIHVQHITANAKHDDIRNDKHDTVQFRAFIKAFLSNIVSFCKGGWYICFSSSTLNELLTPMGELGIDYKSIIIRVKNQSNIGGGDYKRRYEPIVYGYNEHIFCGTPYEEEDVWEFQKTLKNDLHPTMKPIPLVENAISKSSMPGMIVLDFFLGSGTTLIAGEQMKRLVFGLELTPNYTDVIVKRWVSFMTINSLPYTVKRNGVDITSETWLTD